MNNWITVLAMALGIVSAVTAQDVNPKGGRIYLPSISAVTVEKVLYQHASTPHIMGDGHRAYIVQVKPGDLKAFVERNASIDREWTHGSIQKYALYADILEWLERWPFMKENLKEFSKVVDLTELKKTDGLYFKAEYKRNGDGSSFTDATLWIIDPSKSLVIMLNGNT